MTVFPSPVAWLLAVSLLVPNAGGAAEPAVKIAALIDQLAGLDTPGVGYTGGASGTSFLPLDRQGHLDVLLLNHPAPAATGTLRTIVAQGAAALPHLVAHLADDRPTRITIGGLWGPGILTELPDRNPRTERELAVRETREDRPHEAAPDSYTLRVGDLCFVAIGQIVNRRYDAAGYVPTAIVYVQSAARSPLLREAVAKSWGSLTPAQHRAMLVADFLRPDSKKRRVGACQRLAFYYPELLEPLALEFLQRPTYDLGDVRKFLHEQLHRAANARERRALLDAYVARRGAAARDGVLLLLFEDLEYREIEERTGRPPGPDSFGDAPRRALAELYGFPEDVRSTQRPPFLDAVSTNDRRELIEAGLLYDRSPKIDRAVRDLLASSGDDDGLAWACIKRLVGRGFDTDIEQYLRRRSPAIGDKFGYKQNLAEIAGQLGWGPVHVAVARGWPERLRDLLRERADANARAPNGQTPLHLAARAGDLAAVQMLLAAGANPDIRDRDGRTPASLAAANYHDGVVRLLVKGGSQVPDALVAVCADKAEQVRAFLRADRELVKGRDSHGLTLLHRAARLGHTQAGVALLAGGANVDATDKDGWTPLHAAAAAGHVGFVRTLLQHGAKPGACASKGELPLHLAVQWDRPEVVPVLLENKASPDGAESAGGTPPLHLAATDDNSRIAQLLLDGGPRLTGGTRRGGRRCTVPPRMAVWPWRGCCSGGVPTSEPACQRVKARSMPHTASPRRCTLRPSWATSRLSRRCWISRPMSMRNFPGTPPRSTWPRMGDMRRWPRCCWPGVRRSMPGPPKATHPWAWRVARAGPSSACCSVTRR
jgi:ankyrin repeat protein